MSRDQAGLTPQRCQQKREPGEGSGASSQGHGMRLRDVPSSGRGLETSARLNPRCHRWLPALCVALAIGVVLLAVLRQQAAPAPRLARSPTAPSSGAIAPREATTALAPQATTWPAYPIPTPAPRTASPLVQREDWLGLARAFDAQLALAEITRLCRPEFAGRMAGSEGGRRAAEYLASRFGALGLVPAGDAGTCRQEFAVPLVELNGMPTLTVTASTGKEFAAQLRRDFLPIASSYTGSGLGEGPVVWVNRGAHDDYDGLDATGAVVVCRYPADDVFRQAAEHRVAGLLIVREDVASLQMGRVGRDTSWISQTIPAAYVSPEIVSFLLSGADVSYEDLSIQYTPLPLPGRARLAVTMRESERATAQNILGFLPGRSPTQRDEIVVLGAHYDHLGHHPDGTLYPGANDDASGVAVLLEIARSWQAAGFIPERTVLFAAWDAEEGGLLGSTHYVQHPSFPLTSTVAMLQLDMVGAGKEPVLEVDGDGDVLEQALVSAAELGIAARPAAVGRSDHAPFRGSGIPATMLIWAGLDSDDTAYHRPGDTPGNIDLDYLRRAGILSELLALHLSSTQPRLASVVDQEREALRSGAVEDFLASVAKGARRREQERLERWQQAGPQEVDLVLQSLVVASDVATASLHLSYRQGPEPSGRSASYPARFVREESTWRYAGLATREWTGARVRLLAPPDTADEAEDLLGLADALYGQLEQVLDLAADRQVTLELYPRASDLQALAGAGPPAAPAHELLAGDGLLAGREAITETLVSLALARAGLPADKLTWLPVGLARALQELTPGQIAAGHLPAKGSRELAAGAGQVWALQDLPTLATVPSEKVPLWRAQARSVVAYLLQEGGWPHIARLARAAGPALTFDAACRQALGYPLAQLEAGWRADALQQWLDVSLAIGETVRARNQAVAGGDEAAFLATINDTNPTLMVEQQHWFEDVAAHGPMPYEETAVLEELSGDQALVLLTQQIQPEGAFYPTRVTLRARFVARAGRWLYDDLAFEARSSPHFTVEFDPRSQLSAAFLDELLQDAERAWAMLRADWPATPEKVLIKLYPSGGSFGLSVGPSLPQWCQSWSEPGESIKLDRDRVGHPGYVIARELARQALFALGVREAWLQEGVAAAAQSEYDSRRFGADLLSRRRRLNAALRAHREFDLLAPRSWPDVDEDQSRLFQDQAWDAVSYLMRHCGTAPLREALQWHGQGATLDQAFVRATGHSLSTLLASWRRSALVNHVGPQIVAFTGRFDEQRALQTARQLCAPELAGRAAGTTGAEVAARLLAEHFQTLGLTSAGDAGTYFQRFPISCTMLVSTPVLSFAHADGRPIQTLGYRQDYREVIRGRAGGGTAEGEVVWVTQPGYGDARLNGRIALQRLRGDPMAAAEMAWKAGAGGLILVLDSAGDLRLRSSYLPALETETIPVVEITNDALVSLIKASGHCLTELSTERPILRLGFKARIAVPLEVLPAQPTTNVLALLPGRDELLKQELIVVGAHYDHVGSLPDGATYPGANDDASGVGVLLELARLVQTSNWQPRRSILFAAWGAEEMGLLGSQHYVEHPWAPLTQTVAMIQLDMVGQGRGYYLNIHGNPRIDGQLVAALALGADQIDARVSVMAPSDESDQAPFQDQQVPAALLMWREAEDAHLPTDTPDRLDPRKLGVVGRVAAAALRLLGD